MTDYAVVYISIGNSDDKLPQVRWHQFHTEVDRAVRRCAEASFGAVHGAWESPSAAMWQNACWALQLPVDIASIEHLKMRLAELAGQFGQESIAWAVAPDTEFIRPGGDRS